MKNYQIHIDKKLDTNTNQILTDYWLIRDGKFLNKVLSITEKYGIRQGELNKLVEKHSYCNQIDFNCSACNSDIWKKFTQRADFSFKLTSRTNCICQDCRTALEIEYKKEEQARTEVRNKIIRESFDSAVKAKKWLDLKKNELTILKDLIENNTKAKIYANVFKGDYNNKLIWKYVNKFEKLGFLYVNRNGNSVVEFVFDERINNAIQNLSQPRPEVKNAINSHKLDSLSFSLSKKENKQTIRHPDYGGTFILQKNVVLRANEKYIYGGWIQTDGSINLKFTPLSNLQSNNVVQENLNNEPTHISEIINNLYDVIQDSREHALEVIDDDSNSFNDDHEYNDVPW